MINLLAIIKNSIKSFGLKTLMSDIARAPFSPGIKFPHGAQSPA